MSSVHTIGSMLIALCRGEQELSSCWAKFLVLALGMLFLGRQETVEATLEVG